MTLDSLKPELGFYDNRLIWSRLRNIYEERITGTYLRISPAKMDKKIRAQMPKGFMAVNGTIMIVAERNLIEKRYLPYVLDMENDKGCHHYDVVYTQRKPGKVTTLVWLKHIGKELGYDIIPA